MRLVIFCIAVLFLAAAHWEAVVHAQAPDQGSATFCILNVSGWTVFQSNQTVTDNGEALASVAHNQYVFKRVAPGRHVLKIETGRELVIEPIASETYYIKYAYNPSLIAMLSTVTFTQIPKDEAEKLLVQMTPADKQSAALAPPPPARIFIVSSGNDQIVRIDDMSGAGWIALGSRGSGANQLFGPAGIFVNATRKIFVADSNNSRIVRIYDMTGAGWITFGSRGSGTNQFDSPRGIFVDATEKIFVTDSNNSRIVRIDDMTGADWTTFGSFGDGANQFLGPAGIFVDATGKIFVTDAGNRRIVRMDDITGAGWTTFGAAGSGNGQFIEPNGLFVSSAGQISVADSGNNRLVRMDNMSESGWATFSRLSSDGKSRLVLPVGIFVR